MSENEKEFEDMLKMFDDSWDKEKVEAGRKRRMANEIKLPDLSGNFETQYNDKESDKEEFKPVNEEIQSEEEYNSNEIANERDRQPEASSGASYEHNDSLHSGEEKGEESLSSAIELQDVRERGETQEGTKLNLAKDEDLARDEDSEETVISQENNSESYSGNSSEEEFESEAEKDEEFGGGLLAGMPMDEEFEDEIEEELIEEFEDEVKREPSRGNNDSSADEKAREFFSNLKNKIFKKKERNSPRGVKPRREENPKVKKPKENKPKKKRNISFNSIKNLNKKQKVIAGSASSLVVMLILFFIISSSSYTELSKSKSEIKYKDKETEEEISFEIYDLKPSEKNLEVSLKNTGELASNVSFKLFMFEKSINPLGGKKVECESDIINLDGVKETLSCDSNVNPNKKYKIKSEVENF